MRTISVPATSANLGPGFDCLGMALSCHNTIAFEFIPDGLRIDLEVQDCGRIPADDRNLIYRVFCNTLEKYSIEPPGVHFSQVNDIPAMRGMGSSAACVVGGVVMANAYMGETMSVQDMLDACAAEEGHPDNILPALLGGFTVGIMDGGHVRYMRMDAPDALRCVVFVPPFSLSTRKARAALPKTVPMEDAVFNLSHASLLTAALACGDLSMLRFAMQDRMHQSYRKSLVPGYDDIVRIASEQGALSVCLSGAGPTMIAFLDHEEGFLKAVQPALDALNCGWQARLLHIDPHGYRID